MTDQTPTPKPETIQSIITDLADLYGKHLEPGTLAMYREALDEFTVAEVRVAVRPWIRTSKWFPKPAEIIANILERRNEAAIRNRSQEVVSAANDTKIRDYFRVPENRSIIEHVEYLRSQGKSLDEIADELCGPEKPESETRYKCSVCRDTRFARVWHPEAMRAAYDRKPVPRLTVTMPCHCEAGKRLLAVNPKMKFGYDAAKWVVAQGIWHEDEARLSEWASRRFASKRDPDLAQFSRSAQGEEF